MLDCSSYLTAIWINFHWLEICISHWWKPNFKCQLYCLDTFIVNERLPSTKGFYKNEIPIKEFIISPSFIFTKNELLCSFFEVLCPSCRTPILQNISRWLLFKNKWKLWNVLNPFAIPLESTYTLWKHQNIRGFLMLSGSIGVEHWLKMV